MSSESTPALAPLPFPVPHSRDAGLGAATSYVLRRIALRAGAFAPGIQDSIFFDLTTNRIGGTLGSVQVWMASQGSSLTNLGYRFGARWTSVDSSTLAGWVFAGKGHRGAVLPLSQKLLYPGQVCTVGHDHAVGLVIEPVDGDDQLRMVDPWPEAGRGDRLEPPATLDVARREHRQVALALFWVGWS